MRRFLKKISLFLLPIFLYIGFVLSQDVFKLFSNDDYYEETFVSQNRGLITFETYKKQKQQIPFNSFIFGNSRSQAFKCPEWAQYLSDDAYPFHFDASGEGIYGITKKVVYLDENDVAINHALLILDRSLLQRTKNRSSHIAITPPELSQESSYEFYKTFIDAALAPKFVTAYYDFKLNGEFRPYMEGLIRNIRYPDRFVPSTGDIYYGYDEWIKKDSTGYYTSLINEGIFKRANEKPKKCVITNREMQQLASIRKIFEKHQTNYQIIISPVYDQIPMEKEQVDLLKTIFGNERVHDFSGVNEYTSVISNYYEKSHYRPHVANDIMRRIYHKSLK